MSDPSSSSSENIIVNDICDHSIHLLGYFDALLLLLKECFSSLTNNDHSSSGTSLTPSLHEVCMSLLNRIGDESSLKMFI
jgi:hypothetical protein